MAFLNTDAPLSKLQNRLHVVVFLNTDVSLAKLSNQILVVVFLKTDVLLSYLQTSAPCGGILKHWCVTL
jgi:hypothetical protein